ncbi:Lysosomal Pro-X carboxypeptidase [Coccomyxa sp. Obi]|nr:Lysosomal Pro-X carboxypeptidase [Coccomyxa sp. Obi]
MCSHVNHEENDDVSKVTPRGEDPKLQCKVYSRSATLDHFSWAIPPENRTTFKQRYFLCDEHWKSHKDGSRGPIFFYVGNEADVTLYLNATGIMWESAPSFGALLVFAEHRYYGESKPFKKALRHHMQYLTSEQAMADYAELVMELKEEFKAESSAVIGFGGSYGGMLATWMRIKYPHILDGAIAGSAPIWSYLGEDPPYDSGSYAKIVTRDASEEGGSAPACASNVRKAWSTLFEMGRNDSGRGKIETAMRVCPRLLNSSDDVMALANWASSAWDYMAMGNYPYPSTYILNGMGILPAYPVRVACESLRKKDLEGTALLSAFADALGVFYNYSKEVECYDYGAGANPETDEDGSFWDYQWCTEQFQPFSKDGENDMYWDQPFSVKESIQTCQENWGVTPRPLWATVEWGGRRIESASNIVFTNGFLDPWHGGGVLKNISDSLVAIVIPEGAHHLDFMFSHPLDPPSVLAARATQRHHMRRWIAQVAARHATPAQTLQTSAAFC